MTTSTEFVVGKHNIGYIDSDFHERIADVELEKRDVPAHQKLTRYMNDSEIESELKPGICDMSDVLAFLENPPEGTKDGYWNLFYTPTFVVSVDWHSRARHWDVGTWRRGDVGWRGGRRVFSPATARSSSVPSELGDFVSRAEFEEFKRRVEAVLKL